MDLVHDRGSMDPVHESGPWTRSKERVHGPWSMFCPHPSNNCYKIGAEPGNHAI